MIDSVATGAASAASIKDRFRHFNSGRLKRLMWRLGPRQSDFIHLLPLLYQYNHPLLPGYISTDVPCHVFNYMVDDTARECATRYLGPHLQLTPNNEEPQIDAIYLMGSPGSIAFSPQSDIDIWLCVGDSVADAALVLLEAKAKKIDEWAVGLGLEVHTFVLRATTFASRHHSPLSKESSGRLQHQLLLDEFYRSSLYIAGKLPQWWFRGPSVTSHNIAANEASLLNETLDFGELTPPPAQELVTATLWHMYKAISHPSKSFLKLLLLATYTTCYPNIPWVSIRIRDAVINGAEGMEATDHYIAMIDTIAAHSGKSDGDSVLTLATQSLFLRGAQWLSECQKLRYGALVERDLRSLAGLWGWSWNEAMLLVTQASQYRYAIKRARQLLYHIGACFETIQHVSYAELANLQYSQEDSSLISRVIYANIINAPTSIEKLPIGAHAILAAPSDSYIIDVDNSGDKGRLRWHIYYQSYSIADGLSTQELLAEYSELSALVAWAIQNFFDDATDGGQGGKGSPRVLEAARGLASYDSVMALFPPLRRLLRANGVGEVKLDNFRARERVVACWACFGVPQDINAITGDMPAANGGGATVSADYIEVVSITSWQRVLVKSYKGNGAVSHCLVDLLASSSEELTLSAWDFDRNAGRNRPLSAVFLDIYDSILLACRSAAKRGSLLAKIDDSYFLFSRINEDMRMDEARNSDELLALLSLPRQEFHVTHIDKTAYDDVNAISEARQSMERADRATVAGIPLPMLFSHNRGGIIQIYWLATATGNSVLIFDEYGALFYRHHAGAEVDILVSYLKFVQSFGYVGFMAELAAPPPVRTYKVSRNIAGSYGIEPIDLASASMAGTSVNVVVGADEQGALEMSVGTARSERLFGEFGAFRPTAAQAADAYLVRRRAGVEGRFLVTDIGVRGCGDLRRLGITSTLSALQLKSGLETALNASGSMADCSAGDR